MAIALMRGLRDQFEFAVLAVRGVEDSHVGHDMRDELTALQIPFFTGAKLPLKLGGMVFAGARAAAVMRRFTPAAIHLHTEIPEATYAAMVTLQPTSGTIPLLRTIHNSVYWHFWPRLGRWCERRMRGAHVACVSEGAKAAFEVHRAESSAGALPAPPVVIYNGVRSPDIPTSRRRVPTERLRVLFAGRFEPEKGTDLLPQILPLVQPPGTGGELVLHGSGAHRPVLEALAARPPPGWILRVLPPVARLPERMREFDLVIMPSRFEGLGLVAVEATLAGLPVVVTDAAGLREAVPSNHPWRAKAGDPVDFATCLQRAIDHASTWPAAVRQAQSFAQVRFAPERMFVAYRQLYLRALGGASPFHR